MADWYDVTFAAPVKRKKSIKINKKIKEKKGG